MKGFKMFFQNNKKINEKIRMEQFSKEDFMSLEISYEKTVEELGLQQTKRDQIIALYLSILGFVIPSIINLNVPPDCQRPWLFCNLSDRNSFLQDCHQVPHLQGSILDSLQSHFPALQYQIRIEKQRNCSDSFLQNSEKEFSKRCHKK
ncbi:MAG: hypothetical protein IJ691_07960 [Lachnospiraceae bacterium]|nr:hypothetical protein [Lachnospiraceae bacterium]